MQHVSELLGMRLSHHGSLRALSVTAWAHLVTAPVLVLLVTSTTILVHAVASHYRPIRPMLGVLDENVDQGGVIIAHRFLRLRQTWAH